MAEWWTAHVLLGRGPAGFERELLAGVIVQPQKVAFDFATEDREHSITIHRVPEGSSYVWKGRARTRIDGDSDAELTFVRYEEAKGSFVLWGRWRDIDDNYWMAMAVRLRPSIKPLPWQAEQTRAKAKARAKKRKAKAKPKRKGKTR